MANKKKKSDAKGEIIHYWDINPILSYEAHYNVIFGERSNGKTYGVMQYSLERFFQYGEQFAYIRRWDEDIKGQKGEEVFKGLIENGVVKKLSHGKWDSIKYVSRRYYLQRHIVDEEGGIKIEADKEPCGYAFAISAEEHYKSLSFPKVSNIFFDEFITRGAYIEDEFISFMSLLSTLVRTRINVHIFMCANTINKWGNPYFREMGLYNTKNQKEDTIELYSFGELRIACERTEALAKRSKKASNILFSFENPKLEMTRSGAWEMDIYPHCPCKYRPNDIMYQFFIKYEEAILHCEIVRKDDMEFIFVHKKTTPVKEDDKLSLVYQKECDPRPNYRTRLDKPTTKKEQMIATLFARSKVFYATNEEGEIMRNALLNLGE